MRWQRPARWAVAAIGVATAITLYVQTRERPPVNRPSIATPADPEANSQSGEGTTVRYRGDKVAFEMTYATQTVYDDGGRVVWTKGKFSVDDGTVLCADEIEGSGQGEDGMPAVLKMRGNVCMDTSEGASIRAQEATYTSSTGVAILPGPVTFARGRVSGGGTDGQYNRDTGVFHILSNATVTSQAGEQEGPVNATAKSMTFNRAGLALLLDQDAKITHTRQTMSAERATLYLAEEQDQFRVIELRGRASVVPVPGQDTSMPEMNARDIDLAFHEGTQALERAMLVGSASLVLIEGTARRSIEGQEVSVTTAADGKTITHLEARDRVTVRTPAQPNQAARTITAARLVAGGEEGKGLTSAVFSGGARFVESEPGGRGRAARDRIGTGQTLSMRLGGSLDDVEEAYFEQNVTFRDGDVTGDADLGTYMAAKGQLTLRPAPVVRKAPRVTSGRVTVDARDQIDVDLESQDLHARGDVTTVNTGDPAASKTGKPSGLFGGGETMLGFGAEFWYERAAGKARYQGTAAAPARLRQGETDVRGQYIELTEETRDLNAKGGVDSTFAAVAAAGSTDKPKRYRVTSDTLEYRDGPRTASYAGAPVTLRAPDGTTTSRTMVMTLAAEGRELLRLDARGEVYTKLDLQGREALASTLLYEADKSSYTLRGPGLVLRAAGEKPGTCSESRGAVVQFTTGVESPEFPPALNPGGVETKDVACTGALQR